VATSNISDPSNITDINLEQLIADAIKGNKESLHLLRFGPWFTTRLDEMSTYMSCIYGIDAVDIRDKVIDTLSDKIQTIRNPNNRPLSECLLAFCGKIAKNFCLNRIRHNLVKKNYLECLAASEGINGTRISIEGVSIPLKSLDANSPEEILREKEIAVLREKFRADVYLEVKRALDNSSPTDIRIVVCWGAGMMNLKQISEATGIPLSTVHNHLTAWQKQILKKTILDQIVSENPGYRRAGTYEMLRNAITKVTRAA